MWLFLAIFLAGLYLGVGFGLLISLSDLMAEMRAPRMLAVIFLWPLMIIIP